MHGPNAPKQYFNVEILERSGHRTSRDTRAKDATDALRIITNQLEGTGDEAVSAQFSEVHPSNMVPGSRGKSYRGVVLLDGTCPVYVAQPDGIAAKLDPRLDLVSHSPDGFAWGYEGSGPAQLSLALLADALGDDDRALKIYQPFKTYIAGIKIDKEWQLPVSIIEMLACVIERQMSSECAV